MKVQDLFEKKLTMPISQKNTSGILRHPNLGHLGTGVQAIAYYHKKFPGKVVKTVTIEGPNDPSYQFLRLCVNHPENPYFPKIYAFKQYNTSQSKNIDLTGEDRERQYNEINPEDSPPDWAPHQIIVVMERLSPITTNEAASVKMLQAIGILPANLKSLKFKNSNEVRPPLSATNFMFNNDISRKELYQLTPDLDFKKALRLLEPLFRKYSPDLRKHNIMLRRVGGPHLVLIDPIC